jgi:hypothetical protein
VLEAIEHVGGDEVGLVEDEVVGVTDLQLPLADGGAVVGVGGVDEGDERLDAKGIADVMGIDVVLADLVLD